MTNKPVESIAIESLEMNEFLVSQSLESATQLSRDQIREAFRAHRFNVMSWLMSNGVEIDMMFFADQSHPTPGNQYPDQV